MVELLGSLRLKKKDWTNKVNNKVRYTKYIEKLKTLTKIVLKELSQKYQIKALIVYKIF